jgi:hypothetical protein
MKICRPVRRELALLFRRMTDIYHFTALSIFPDGEKRKTAQHTIRVLRVEDRR